MCASDPAEVGTTGAAAYESGMIDPYRLPADHGKRSSPMRLAQSGRETHSAVSPFAEIQPRAAPVPTRTALPIGRPDQLWRTSALGPSVLPEGDLCAPLFEEQVDRANHLTVLEPKAQMRPQNPGQPAASRLSSLARPKLAGAQPLWPVSRSARWRWGIRAACLMAWTW
jgi:hypothetical protein